MYNKWVSSSVMSVFIVKLITIKEGCQFDCGLCHCTHVFCAVCVRSLREWHGILEIPGAFVCEGEAELVVSCVCVRDFHMDKVR